MSSGLSQAKRLASFKTPLGDDKFAITRFDGTEGLSELFEFRIEAVSDDENADLSQILGERCSVKYNLRGGGTRIFSGVLAEAQRLGSRGARCGYRFVLKPWLWLLSHRSDCKIFENKTAPDVIKEIFNKEGKKSFDDRLSESYQTMEYCVQYRETDLSFVLRLMEQHGIYYYFKHSEGGHELILSDAKSSHDTQRAPVEEGASGGGSYPFLPRGKQDRRTSEHFVEWFSRPPAAHRPGGAQRLRLQAVDGRSAPLEGGGPAGREEVRGLRLSGQVHRAQGRGALRRDPGPGAAGARRAPRGGWGGAEPAPGGPDQPRGPFLLLGERRVPGRAGAPFLRPSGLSLHSHVGRPRAVSRALRVPQERAPFPRPAADPEAAHPRPADREGGGQEAQGEEIDVDEYGCIYVQFHWDRDKTPPRAGCGWRRSGRARRGAARSSRASTRRWWSSSSRATRTSRSSSARSTTTSTASPTSCRRTRRSRGVKSNSTKGGGGYNEFIFEDKQGLGEDRPACREGSRHSVVKNAETRDIGEEVLAAEGRSGPRQTTVKNGDDVLKIDKGSTARRGRQPASS